MNANASTHEKGLAFEQRLARLFESKGYQVAHNVRLTGRSGAPHQIDVHARLVGPLHTSTLIVEAKSYRMNIDKDRVMKLIQIVDDVGADRGVIVTTSEFTTGAIKTAEGHNIDLWGRQELARLLGEVEISAVEEGLPRELNVATRCVMAGLNIDEVRARLEAAVSKKAKGGFLGAGKVIETLDGIKALHYPYYEVELEWATSAQQRVGLLKKESVQHIVNSKITVDAAVGVLVNVANTGIEYDYNYLAALDADEVRVLRAVGEVAFNAGTLVGLGYSDGKAKKIINTLLVRGLAERTQSRPAIYKCKVLMPADPRAVCSISEIKELDDVCEPQFQTYEGPIREPSAIFKAVESYWLGTDAKGASMVYYPYFLAGYRRADGSHRIEVIDAVTGTRNFSLEGAPSAHGTVSVRFAFDGTR
jgi:HJR/Mrr/RecB family endonuclease